jgi:hypothetical protein
LSIPLISEFLAKQGTPLLESFSFYINVDHDDNAESPPQLTSCGIQQQHLKALSFSGLTMDTPHLSRSCRSQLTRLSMEGDDGAGVKGLSVIKALEIIRHCRNLTYCRLDFGINSEPYVIELVTQTVTVPLLKTLRIRELINLTSFFARLHLPALSNLHFSTTSMSFHRISFCELLHRTSSLDFLTLSSHNITQGALVECIQLAITLTHLSVLVPIQLVFGLVVRDM